jgi:hypothetical protein
MPWENIIRAVRRPQNFNILLYTGDGKNTVLDFILSLNADQQAMTCREIELLQKYGRGISLYHLSEFFPPVPEPSKPNRGIHIEWFAKGGCTSYPRLRFIDWVRAPISSMKSLIERLDDDYGRKDCLLLDGFFTTQTESSMSDRAMKAIIFSEAAIAEIEKVITGEISPSEMVPGEEKNIWKGNMKWKDAKKIIFQNMDAKNCYKAMKVNIIKDKRGCEVVGKQNAQAGECIGIRSFKIKHQEKYLLHGFLLSRTDRRSV